MNLAFSPPDQDPNASPPYTAVLNLEESADPIAYEPRPMEEPPEEELLTIIVEIGDGREEPITVYHGDKAEVLAAGFAKKHRLDKRMEVKLVEHIQQNIDQALIDVALEESVGRAERESRGNPESDLEFEKWQNEMEKNLKESIRTGPAINPVSKKIAEGKALTSLPVHQRLHMQAMNKQKAAKHAQEQSTLILYILALELASNIDSGPKEVNMRPSSSDRRSLNYGQRLYQKGVKKREERDREINEMKKDQEIKEQRYYTFKPDIDPISKQILKNSNKDKAEDRLIMFGQVVQEKKEQQRTVFAIEDKLKCTFHPEVNKKFVFALTSLIGVKEWQMKRSGVFQWKCRKGRQAI